MFYYGTKNKDLETLLFEFQLCLLNKNKYIDKISVYDNYFKYHYFNKKQDLK